MGLTRGSLTLPRMGAHRLVIVATALTTVVAVTGLYWPRQVSSEYWSLDDVTPAGSSTANGFTTYGPLTAAPAAFAVSPKCSGHTRP